MYACQRCNFGQIKLNTTTIIIHLGWFACATINARVCDDKPTTSVCGTRALVTAACASEGNPHHDQISSSSNSHMYMYKTNKCACVHHVKKSSTKHRPSFAPRRSRSRLPSRCRELGCGEKEEGGVEEGKGEKEKEREVRTYAYTHNVYILVHMH